MSLFDDLYIEELSSDELKAARIIDDMTMEQIIEEFTSQGADAEKILDGHDLYNARMELYCYFEDYAEFIPAFLEKYRHDLV